MENDGPGGTALAVAAAVVGLPTLVVWAGAAIAAWMSGRDFDAGLTDAVRASVRLPASLADPAAAWSSDAAAGLPGPGTYWAGTAMAAGVVVVVVTGLLGLWRRLRRVGTADRRRLGVDARARLARPRDLRPLFVPEAQPGRFILGRVGRWPLRRLVASECRATTRASRRPAVRKRQGDTGAVALVGPTRSGKTVAAVAGILEWHGPAILSSVKSDLMKVTIGWRARQGDVRVYDPLGLTHAVAAGWSPLTQANSMSGARQAARHLLQALADDGTSNYGMWKALAEYLLGASFWVAANSNRDISDVVRWVLTQDMPGSGRPSELDELLHGLLQHPDPRVAAFAPAASDALVSLWTSDERPRSSVYVTAQAALAPFADPAIADAARTTEFDLDWLLSGNNTLYICSPLDDQERLAPAFGGVVNDLMAQIYKRVHASETEQLPRRVLVVLEEAGNQRLDRLPEYASTVSGMGVQLVTCWQSLAQIHHAYDKAAGIVLTNHLSKVFYTGMSDEESFNYVGKVLGDEEIESRQIGEHPPQSRTDVTDSTQRVALVQPHTLRQMRPGDGLLLHGTLPPAHVRTRRYYAERSLRKRAALPIPSQLRRRPNDSTHAQPARPDDMRAVGAPRDDPLARVNAPLNAAARGAPTLDVHPRADSRGNGPGARGGGKRRNHG